MRGILLCIILTSEILLWLYIALDEHRWTRSSVSCRVGDRRDERGRHGLSLIFSGDGHAQPAVVKRERVRKTRPDANQWFFYFRLHKHAAIHLRSRALAYAVVEYLLADERLTRNGSVVLVLEYDGENQVYRLEVPASTTNDSWHYVAFPVKNPRFEASDFPGFSLASVSADFRLSAECAGAKLGLLVRRVIVVTGR